MPKSRYEERREYYKRYYQKNRERILKRMKEYRRRNLERLRAYDRERYWKKRRLQRMEYERKRRFQMKYTVLRHYSKSDIPFCECCGEKRIEFLTIDHILGGGNKHRKQLGTGKGSKGFYKWLIENNFPDGYRVLCFNCNTALASYGYCPHKTPSKFQDENGYPRKEMLEKPLLKANK